MPQLNANINVFENNLEESTSEKRGKLRGSYVGLNFEGMIPIPIQIFLWRQSEWVFKFEKKWISFFYCNLNNWSPFIKKNFGNLTEASALVCWTFVSFLFIFFGRFSLEFQSDLSSKYSSWFVTELIGRHRSNSHLVISSCGL